MEPELEGSHDPEVRARASQPPEQVSVLLVARPHELPVSGHQLDGPKVVDGETVLPLEPPHSAAERQSRDSRVPDHSDGADEPERLCLSVELVEERASVRVRDSPLRVDLDASHA